MTSEVQTNRSRNLFVSNAGLDTNNGFTEDFPKRELSAAITAAEDLSPTIAEPVAIVEIGATRYFGDFIIPDFVRVDMNLSSINNGSIKLPDTSNVNLASILTTFDASGASPRTAVDTNSKSRASLTCLGIVLLGKGDTGYSVSGASSENFCEIGQVSCIQDDCTLVKVDTTGLVRQLDFKEVNIGSTVSSFPPNNPNNCIGVEYNAASSESMSMNIGSLTNDKSGTGNTGVLMQQGHMHFNGSEINFAGEDAIIANGGELDVDCSDIQGRTTNNGASVTIDTQRYLEDIIHNSGDTFVNTQIMTGDIVSEGDNFNFSGQKIEGNITINDGVAQFTFQQLTGNFTANGGTTGIVCNAEIGDFTISPGALVFADIFAVTGTIINFGGLNGIVNGVRYGTYIEGSTNVVTGLRNGNIQSSYDEPCLRLTITGDDTITAISCGYRQNPSASRTVGFRIIDADNSTIYWEATNTETTSNISHIFEFDLIADEVNALPSNQVVNLLVQAERVAGNGTSDANAQIEFTRV